MKQNRKPARYRPRKELKFWLYHDVESDSRLLDYIAFLKQTRQFATYVKRGLRLLWTLGEGDLTYLFELFPQLAERLNPPPAPPDKGDLQRMIETSVQTSVQAAMMNLPTIPAPPTGYPSMKPSAAPPVGQTKAAPQADASAIADDFLAFIQ